MMFVFFFIYSLAKARKTKSPMPLIPVNFRAARMLLKGELVRTSLQSITHDCVNPNSFSVGGFAYALRDIPRGEVITMDFRDVHDIKTLCLDCHNLVGSGNIPKCTIWIRRRQAEIEFHQDGP